MKRVVLHLFAFVLFSVATNAGYAATLVVKSRTPETFSVSIDHQRTASRVNMFQTTGLVGRHRVAVVYDCFDTNFDLHNDVLYDAWVDFGPAETMTLDIQPNGTVYASSCVAPVAQPRVCRVPRVAVCRPATACNNDYAYNGYVDSYNYLAPLPVYCGLAPDALPSLKQAVLNRNFDSTKRDLLAGALRNNPITSQQLYELLNLLDFESSKVEIAKLAYNNVVDKQNFFRVYDAFTFDSSIRELQRYIG